METKRTWDGKAVQLESGSLGSILTGKPVEIQMTEEGAKRLSWALASYAAIRQERHVSRDRLLLPEVQELLDALNYVMVGDPTSSAKHRALQAGKGMTPDGGFKFPNPPRDGRGFIRPEDRSDG